MKLFHPGKIGKLSIKNRIVMAPMNVGGLAEPDGHLGERSREYYRARAKGGVGLIITGATQVSREIEYIEGGASFPIIDGAGYISSFSELADSVHDFEAKIAVQLTPGRGRIAPNEYLRAIGAVAPSPIPCMSNPHIIARELSRKEIERLVQSFAFAAETLRRAGIDAVELHAHSGHLLDQFQTALWNKRTDEYGGDLGGRLRFAVEIISAIKEAAGSDFPIIYRFGLTHYYEGGRDIEEGLEITRRLEAAGIDAFHIDAGCHEVRYWGTPPTTRPPGCLVHLAQEVKKVVKVPVISVGKLGYPEIAEKVLQEEKADFIALGRPLLADPEWPRKVKEGRLDDIRPCVGCYEGCLERINNKKYISCAVNPTTGMEKEFALEPAGNQKSVLVVGGGPAGMEAARVAALRGHRVTLWEKDNALGGNLIPASIPACKQDYRKFLDYLTNQIKGLDIRIELGKAASVKSIQEENPDVLFIATGTKPIIPPIPGVEKENVVTAVELLLGNKKAGRTAVVLGGGLVGCEAALYLAEQGKRVTIVEILPKVAGDLFISNRMHLIKLLADAGARILTETRVSEIADNGVWVAQEHGEKNFIVAETIVLATGLQPKQEDIEILSDKIPEIFFLGDCVQPRKILNAIWDGFRKARLI